MKSAEYKELEKRIKASLIKLKSVEFEELEKRIKSSSDQETLQRLEKSMDRLFYTGIISAKELGRLDTLIMEKLAEVAQ